ncbi:hypothetical protein D918_05247 [Trichuris suis]|nr:hypothetical protein D918_05247 [Trichuris suis]
MVIAKARPVTPTHHAKVPVFIHECLSRCSHVFVCHATVLRPLTPSCDAPYAVLGRQDKFYTIRINTHAKNRQNRRTETGVHRAQQRATYFIAKSDGDAFRSADYTCYYGMAPNVATGRKVLQRTRGTLNDMPEKREGTTVG